MPAITIEVADVGAVSDGYHTFSDLYEHRHALFCALAVSHPEISWTATEHQDQSPMYEGYFLAGMNLPVGSVSYHLPVSFWSLLESAGVPTYEYAPVAFDGHTPEDVVARLLEWAGLGCRHDI